MNILIVIVILAAAFIIAVVFQPAEFRVAREISIPVPPAAVFANVNDLHKWQAWSPWAKLDPAAKQTYEGPQEGTGAAMGWASENRNVGVGKMTITESRPNELVRFRLEFLKPFTATNSAEFRFAPQGERTLVTWSMSGKNNFMSKAFSLVINCDKMVGGQFEKGLASLSEVSMPPLSST